MKKVKKNKKIDPPQLGFEPQILEQNFPAQDLNFEGRLDQSSSWFLKNLDFNRMLFALQLIFEIELHCP